MSTLQENQSLNAEYERNKKEREMKEEIERLNNIINKLDSFDWIIDVKNELYIDCNGNEEIFKYYDKAIIKLTGKFFLILREMKGEDKE